MKNNHCAGFSLIEMLVVIGIIVILMGATAVGYSSMSKRAQKARGKELVSNVATALNILFQKQGRWPTALMTEANGGHGRLTARAAACLSVNNLLSLTHKKVESDGESYYTLSGIDRFGIISPWAQTVVKQAGTSGGENLKVPSGGTVKDHVLYYALDKTGVGLVDANVGGVPIKVRANAIVWCAGMDGVEDPYPYSGGGSAEKGGQGKQGGTRGGDDIYSWAPSQLEK